MYICRSTVWYSFQSILTRRVNYIRKQTEIMFLWPTRYGSERQWLHPVDDSSVVIDFSTVLINIAPVINRAEEPRSSADRVAPVGSGVISEARERVVASAMIVAVSVLMRWIMRLMVMLRIVVRASLHTKEVAYAIAHGGSALAWIVIGRGVGARVGMGTGVRLVGMGRLDILG